MLLVAFMVSAAKLTLKSHYHTYHYGEVARSLYKFENNGEFTVDELIKLIPASLRFQRRSCIRWVM
jgi:hypothetical protein